MLLTRNYSWLAIPRSPRITAEHGAWRLPPIFGLFISLSCVAQTIEGTVLNKTTGRPEPRHEVILYTAGGEQAHTTTDDAGAFRMNAADQSSHSLEILKVVHDGVEYFEPVALGKRADVTVYDASSQGAGISCYLSMLQFQIKGRMLQVTELHALKNASNPPVTRTGPDNLLLSIPDDATIKPAIVSGPEGGTLQVPVAPVHGERGQYGIDFPLKPGLTKYAITYEIAYREEFIFRRRSQYPLRRVGVLIPESMQFHSLEAHEFHRVADRQGAQELVLDRLREGQLVTFELSGLGELSHPFRSLNAGQSQDVDIQGQVARLMATPWPIGGSLPNASRSPNLRTTSLVPPLMLAIVILTVAGILLWLRLRSLAARQ